jgi:hypothetical protein
MSQWQQQPQQSQHPHGNYAVLQPPQPSRAGAAAPPAASRQGASLNTYGEFFKYASTAIAQMEGADLDRYSALQPAMAAMRSRIRQMQERGETRSDQLEADPHFRALWQQLQGFTKGFTEMKQRHQQQLHLQQQQQQQQNSTAHMRHHSNDQQQYAASVQHASTSQPQSQQPLAHQIHPQQPQQPRHSPQLAQQLQSQLPQTQQSVPPAGSSVPRARTSRLSMAEQQREEQQAVAFAAEGVLLTSSSSHSHPQAPLYMQAQNSSPHGGRLASLPARAPATAAAMAMEQRMGGAGGAMTMNSSTATAQRGQPHPMYAQQFSSLPHTSAMGPQRPSDGSTSAHVRQPTQPGAASVQGRPPSAAQSAAVSAAPHTPNSPAHPAASHLPSSNAPSADILAAQFARMPPAARLTFASRIGLLATMIDSPDTSPFPVPAVDVPTLAPTQSHPVNSAAAAAATHAASASVQNSTAAAAAALPGQGRKLALQEDDLQLRGIWQLAAQGSLSGPGPVDILARLVPSQRSQIDYACMLTAPPAYPAAPCTFQLMPPPPSADKLSKPPNPTLFTVMEQHARAHVLRRQEAHSAAAGGGSAVPMRVPAMLEAIRAGVHSAIQKLQQDRQQQVQAQQQIQQQLQQQQQQLWISQQ